MTTATDKERLEQSTGQPIPPAQHETPTAAVDQATLQDMQQVGTLENELSHIIKPTDVQSVEKVEHEGKTLLNGGAHPWHFEGDTLVVNEPESQFKQELGSSTEETGHWFAVWIQRIAKVKHAVLKFLGGTSA